ncbi:MAG: hypothetical protein V4708_17430 [Bacteroidota bacterium]|mgnify:CR=1 FL=1
MDIDIANLKKAYIDCNGSIIVNTAVFKIKLFDPTFMIPHLFKDQWCVYTPYGFRKKLRHGSKTSIKLGASFYCPPGFVIYFYTSAIYTNNLLVESKIVLTGDTSEIQLVVANIGISDCLINGYMNIAMFVILPIINTN